MKKILAVILSVCMIACVAVSLTACNKDEADFTVGICQLAPHVALDAATQGFKDALQAEMDKAGKTIKFDYQNAEGDSATCSTIVTSFAQKKCDLVMANATPALQAAVAACPDIPVLGTSITEYGVALGLKNFNGVIGTNVSGTSDLAKQAQMIVDLMPSAQKIGLLYCSGEDNSLYQVTKVSEYLVASGKTTSTYAFADSNDISAVLSRIENDGVDAVYIPTDNTCANNTGIIKDQCSKPIFAGEEGICIGVNGVATLSISYYNLGVKTGKMAAEILLNGGDITTMAIAYDETPVYKYNEAKCQELGITVPSNYEKLVIEK